MSNKMAIVSEAKQEALVSSCSECCMSTIDGKPNIKGMLHQQMMTVHRKSIHGDYSFLDCQNCPVTLNVSEEEWQRMLNEIDGTP